MEKGKIEQASKQKNNKIRSKGKEGRLRKQGNISGNRDGKR